MKENSIKNEQSSIEEAIETMKHWIEYEKANKKKINKADELISIQETILSDYKRVLKENEELKKYKEYYSSARQLVDNNYIQKQKVKEVIKELEDNIYRIKKQYSNGGENCNTVYLENLAQVKILKQILKEVE